MDIRVASDLAGQTPVYGEPPARRQNTIRAIAIICASSLLSGLIFFGCYLYYQHTYAPQPQTSTTVTGQATAFPQSKRAVVHAFGGEPAGWHRTGQYAWRYNGLFPIEVPYGKNVTITTYEAGLHWQEEG